MKKISKKMNEKMKLNILKSNKSKLTKKGNSKKIYSADTSSPEKKLQSSKKRALESNPGKSKKQKMDLDFLVIKNNDNTQQNQLKVSFSLSGESDHDCKEPLKQILNHCDDIQNPRYIFCKYKTEESFKKGSNVLKDIRLDKTRKLYLQSLFIPSEKGSSDQPKKYQKVLLLPKKHVSSLDNIIKHYKSKSYQKIVELNGKNIYLLSFASEAAVQAATKSNYSVGGFVVTLKDCEDETEVTSEEASKVNKKSKSENRKENENDHIDEEDEDKCEEEEKKDESEDNESEEEVTILDREENEDIKVKSDDDDDNDGGDDDDSDDDNDGGDDDDSDDDNDGDDDDDSDE